jgi:protein SCO1/2
MKGYCYMRNWIFHRWPLALLLALMLSACTPAPAPADDSFESFVPSAGTPIEPPVVLTDFSLPGSEGAATSLSDLRGKVVLLFFGYTFCPDVCPTTLGDLKRVRAELGDKADQLAVLMVSVDPERDTPEVLSRYMAAFGEGFIGLSGDEATLRRIGKEYGLYYQRQGAADSSAGYLVDHSSATYLVDPSGQLRMVYGYGTPSEVFVPDIERFMAGG